MTILQQPRPCCYNLPSKRGLINPNSTNLHHSPAKHCFKLKVNKQSHILSVFIDSGADTELIFVKLVHQLGHKIEPLPKVLKVKATDDHLLTKH